MPKKATTNLIFFWLCLIFLSSLPNTTKAEANELMQVYGKVIDSTTMFPLPNTSIVFWDGRRMFAAETDASGSYIVNVTGRKLYQVYAYRNSFSTLSFDYVPAYKEIYIEKGAYNLTFSLFPGASIEVKGELRFFKTLQSPTAIYFTIVYNSGLRTNATSYSEDSIMGQLLNLRGRLLFVPCDVPFRVEVDIYYSGKTKYHLLIDNEGDFLVLNRGDLINVDLGRQILLIEVNSCYDYLASTQALFGEAERVGFYVLYERDALLSAKNLLDAAMSAMSERAYDEAFVDLREAYFIVKRIEEDLPSLYLNASVSTLFITPFLCFTAIATAALVSEKSSQRLALTLALYGLLLLLLYLLYPGYIILGIPKTLMLAFASFLIVYFVVCGFPYAFKEKTSKEGVSRISAIIMAFSLSTKNLRRRKLRTFLTLTLMLTSVFAFIALTSFSMEYGLLIRHIGKAGSTEGFLIRKPSTSGTVPFDPIQPETYRWLQELPEITMIAPKIENIPQEPPFGFLIAPASLLTFQIDGIVGVAPSQETIFTKIDRIIVQGRFLRDEDLNGMLISEEAAKYFGVGINDTLQLFNQSFTLTGIFATKSFDKIEDPDGTAFAPCMLVEPLGLAPCSGYSVVIVQQKIAKEFPRTTLSRIILQTRDVSEIMSLARQAVLKWTSIEAVVFWAGQSYQLFIGSYYLANGFIPAIVPLALAALNIKVLMGNVVDERKKEVMIMSTLGLNPFHITALFLAETLTISIVAGSLGYLLGITSYRFMTLLPFPPLVKHKVEAIWGILALISSITAAVLGSAIPALKSSIIVTPSLVKKWKIEEKPLGSKDLWVLSMPIRFRRENLDDFFTFIKNRLRTIRGHGLGLFEVIENINEVREESKPASKKLFFTCVDLEYRVRLTENELTSTETIIPNWYVIKLTSRPRQVGSSQSEFYVWKASSLIRHLILLYTTEHRSQKP